VSTQLVLSPTFPPPQCHLYSNWCHHTVAPYHVSLPLNQDELVASALSFGNTSSRRLTSWAETEALNPHHHSRPLSPDRLTLTLHYYKKIIPTLVTLTTTQLCLYFISSIARALRHRSSTHHHRSLSPLSHSHHHST
jgi:hypothetical protein